jgi:hypothetical protein|uniref:Uncharacterized protein n=1 Tax=Sipha flava TaxID=143950 RepID=A0A2S2Q8W3_9HEMI
MLSLQTDGPHIAYCNNLPQTNPVNTNDQNDYPKSQPNTASDHLIMPSDTPNETTPPSRSQSNEYITAGSDQNVEINDSTQTIEVNDLNTPPPPPNSSKPENNITRTTTQKRLLPHFRNHPPHHLLTLTQHPKNRFNSIKKQKFAPYQKEQTLLKISLQAMSIDKSNTLTLYTHLKISPTNP